MAAVGALAFKAAPAPTSSTATIRAWRKEILDMAFSLLRASFFGYGRYGRPEHVLLVSHLTRSTCGLSQGGRRDPSLRGPPVPALGPPKAWADARKVVEKSPLFAHHRVWRRACTDRRGSCGG